MGFGGKWVTKSNEFINTSGFYEVPYVLFRCDIPFTMKKWNPDFLNSGLVGLWEFQLQGLPDINIDLNSDFSRFILDPTLLLTYICKIWINKSSIWGEKRLKGMEFGIIPKRVVLIEQPYGWWRWWFPSYFPLGKLWLFHDRLNFPIAQVNVWVAFKFY